METSLLSEPVIEQIRDYSKDIVDTQFLVKMFLQDYSHEFGWTYLQDIDKENAKYSTRTKATWDAQSLDIAFEVSPSDFSRLYLDKPYSQSEKLSQWYEDFRFGLSRHGSLELGAELAYTARNILQRTRMVREMSGERGHTKRDSMELRNGAPFRKTEMDIAFVAADPLQTVQKNSNVFPVLQNIAHGSQNPRLSSLISEAERGNRIPSKPFIHEMGIPCPALSEEFGLWHQYESQAISIHEHENPDIYD